MVCYLIREGHAVVKALLAHHFVRLADDYCLPGPDDDELPPFFLLTNDEDRERKAEYRPPGTYNLIVNPSSFSELDEYGEGGDEANPNWRSLSKDQSVRRSSFASTQSRSSTDLREDPNVVILSKFQDDSGGIPNSSIHRTPSSRSTTSTPPVSFSTPMMHPAEISYLMGERSLNQTFLEIPYRPGENPQLISHFNRFVQRSFAQVHRDSLGTLLDTDTFLAHEVFAQHALQFPPVWDPRSNCILPLIFHRTMVYEMFRVCF